MRCSVMPFASKNTSFSLRDCTSARSTASSLTFHCALLARASASHFADLVHSISDLTATKLATYTVF
jgi:hypothetical protein